VGDGIPLRAVEALEEALRVAPWTGWTAGVTLCGAGLRGIEESVHRTGESMPTHRHFPAGARRPGDTPDRNATWLAYRSHAILGNVIEQVRFYFFYGSGSPAAVGRA
jgi:hypothetical protein